MGARVVGIATYLIFSAIWLLPMYLKHRKTQVDPFYFYLILIALGVLSCFPALGVQGGISYVMGIIGTERGEVVNTLMRIFFVLIGIAACEELCKFLFSKFLVERVPNLSEAGSMLLMSMAGFGFGIVEIWSASGLAEGVVRGILNMHIFLQLWMGRNIYHAWQAKKQGDKGGYIRNILLALGVPILVHFIYDYGMLRGASLLAKGQTVLGVIIYCFAMITTLVFIVVTMVGSYKALKREKTS